MNEQRENEALRSRRTRMKGELIEHMRRVHRRRRIVRTGVGAATLAAIALGVTLFVPRAPSPPSPVSVASRPTPTIEIVGTESATDVTMVRSDDVDISGVFVRSSNSVLARNVIDNEVLIGVLVEIGRPAGLVCMDGSCRLSADVTDRGMDRERPVGEG